MYMYIYIYIYRERERYMCTHICMCIYIYIYMCIVCIRNSVPSGRMIKRFGTRLHAHAQGACICTPGLHHKISVFSDPDPGKS